jgi:hypothetical protein
LDLGFGSGVRTSERAAGGKDIGKKDAYFKSIDSSTLDAAGKNKGRD